MAKMKSSILKDALILFLITIISGSLLGFTYEITKEPIRIQQEITKNKALKSVIEGADEFLSVTIVNDDSYVGILNVYEAKSDNETIGYAFEMSTKEGYGGVIKIMVGLDTHHTILGIDLIKHSETPGLGAKADESEFKSEFTNEVASELTVVKIRPSDQEAEISAITSATITSKAVTRAVNVAIKYYNENIMEVE